MLEKIKKLIEIQPPKFFMQLQQLCFSAGVKVVHTPNLPKTSLHGSTRWLHDTPLIQLSNSYQRNDIFWFTFFHEAGHIILHGKQEVFVEGLKYTPDEQIKENEADEFATKYMLTKDNENEIRKHLPLTKEKAVAYANKFHTHPAVIIGRFARNDKALNQKGFIWKIYQKIEFEI